MSDDAGNVESRASELGWVPKDQFKGDPEKWIDAETFVKRGEEIMPLLKATNRRQTEELKALRQKVQSQDQALAEARDAIEALKETTSKAAIAEVKKTREDLKGKLKEARENEDIDSELEIQEQIRQANQALEEADNPEKKKKPAAEKPTAGSPEDPSFVEWREENTWFGKDRRKTSLALGIAQELRESGDKTEGKEFFDKVTAELNKTLGITPDSRRAAPSKVEGDSRPSGGPGSGRKTFADLPADAQAVCDRQGMRLVGPNRAFKDIESWRKHYVTKFFEE